MSTPLNYCGVTDADLPALSWIMQHAFASDAESCTKWLVAAGIEHLRAVRSGRAGDGGPIRGTLLRIPMGQFFGGQSVSMLGIAGVGVPPEARGAGVARAMMADALREAHADGFALSTLYASTQALYRQVGYEQAGFQFHTRIPVRQIDLRAKTPNVRPLTPGDEDAVRACYRAFATSFTGLLDRGPYVWRRTREWRDKSYTGFGVYDGPASSSTLEGYVFLAQEQGEHAYGKHDVLVSDIAFTTPRAARRLLGFLADFATMGDSIVLHCGPLHPLISLTNAIMLKIEKQEYWMLRVVSVQKALEQRGYHPAARGVLQLDVHDETIPANAGSWTLAIERGQATVRKENQIRPTIRTTTRALAPLYSGLYTARQLRMMGWLEGDDAAIDAADGLFMGTTPWMSDFF